MIISGKVMIFFILKVDCFSGVWKFYVIKKGDKLNLLLIKRKGIIDRVYY